MSTQIIIVDDDPLIAEMLATAASMIGFQTLTFMHGVEFLSYDVQPQDIVVLDLNMPGFDGIEVLRALSEKNISVALVLISGQDRGVLHSAEKLARAHAMDVIGSLTKPITIPEFQHLLLKQYAAFRDQKFPLGNEEKLLPEADEVEHAIRDGQLVVHYQPQVDMKTSLMVGVEALVRWQHPERGMIYPDMFIPVAEKNGLMGELTASVFSSVLKDSQAWWEEGLTLHQSINISADNISSLGLPEQLMSLLDAHQRAPSSLTLEITESTLMDELVTSLDILTRLRMKGFELSIDDFGTGYSSLSHLHRIPFTELKIDRGFVSDMIEDTEARAITKTCIMLGHELNMKVVAEGIESQAIWDMLVEYGCDYAQGYYIAKPMPAEALLEWSVSNKHKN
ncbi:MAG: EAL domain-containing response regulator [Pseudomonadales bacterium]|nr:EAL domain-containing response regulator [Pseudomonadales bacterium]